MSQQASRRYALALTLALGVTLTIAVPPAAAQESSLALEALVANGTAGGSSAEGLAVVLQAFRGQEEAGRWEATVATDGRVRFQGLDPAEDLVYLLSALYEEVLYSSMPFSLSSPPQEPPTLTVYEPTREDGAVRIVSDTTIILGPEGTTGTLRAMQVTTFENTGDRTFVGPVGTEPRTVILPLPPQAFDVAEAHRAGSLAPLEAGAIASTVPLLPGLEEMILSYRLLYTGGRYTFSKRYNYPVDRVRLLVPATQAVEPVGAWERGADVAIEGNLYARFEAAGSANTGATFAAGIGGLPRSAGGRSRAMGSALRYAAIGLGGTALAAVALYAAFWGSRRRPAVGPANPISTREAALERLASLEEEFEAGRLTAEEYAAQREAERQALRRLMEEGRA